MIWSHRHAVESTVKAMDAGLISIQVNELITKNNGVVFRHFTRNMKKNWWHWVVLMGTECLKTKFLGYLCQPCYDTVWIKKNYINNKKIQYSVNSR